jgi:hypothetical protein
MVRWDRTERHDFERVINAMLYREHADADSVRALDGRGGDGGRDLVVARGDRRSIFQLKHFPDGFSASERGRRRQIKKSFYAALAHAPTDWTLVVPCDLTPGEWAFVDSLTPPGGAAGPKISVLDRSGLDERLAGYPDLVAMLQRDELVEKVAAYSQERAMLTDARRDLPARLGGLVRAIEEVDPHWTMALAAVDGRVSWQLVAKHPRAPDVSPISITMTLDLTGQPSELQRLVERSLWYGTSEAVTLPAEAVRRWVVDGPAWLATEASDVEIEWRPTPPDVLPVDHVDLVVTGKLGTSERHQGVVRHVGRGCHGHSLEATFHGGVEVRMLFPDDRDAPAQVSFSTQMNGLHPGPALHCYALLRALVAGDAVELHVEGHRLVTLREAPSTSPESIDQRLPRFEEMVLVAEDLDVVQRHCGTYFAIPDDLGLEERVALRVARLLVDGNCVVDPHFSGGERYRTGASEDALDELNDGQERQLVAHTTNYVLQLGHQELELGAAAFVTERGVVRSVVEHVEGVGPQVRQRVGTADGSHFRTYLIDRFPGAVPAATTAGWGLPDITEPSG